MSQTHRRLRLAGAALIKHLGGDCSMVLDSFTAELIHDTPHGAAQYTLRALSKGDILVVRSDRPGSPVSTPFRFQVDDTGRAVSCELVASDFHA